MKKFMGGLLLIGGFVFSSAQTISFEKTTIDYGTVPVNADGNRVFTFKNTGNKPLILSNVQPGCDWERTRFTMEPKLSAQVIKSFVDLYNKGLIYRGYRMVNWDPEAKTNISDEEVIYKEINGKL